MRGRGLNAPLRCCRVLILQIPNAEERQQPGLPQGLSLDTSLREVLHPHRRCSINKAAAICSNSLLVSSHRQCPSAEIHNILAAGFSGLPCKAQRPHPKSDTRSASQPGYSRAHEHTIPDDATRRDFARCEVISPRRDTSIDTAHLTQTQTATTDLFIKCQGVNSQRLLSSSSRF